MGGYGEGFKQQEGQKERVARNERERESGSERCDREREIKRLKLNKWERAGREASSASLHFGVREFTVNQ